MSVAGDGIGEGDRAPPRPDRSPVTRETSIRPLQREWFERPVLSVASDLLGVLVVRDGADGSRIGRITEVEAYDGPADRASHARVGLTRRTAPMFGPAGHAYVYLVYGVHHCLNVVAHAVGHASAVLIRAIEPIEGIDDMRVARRAPRVPTARLAAGPGLVCQALSIDRSLDGHDLTAGERLWLAEDVHTAGHRHDPSTGPRVGVAYAGPGWADRPWRFGVRGHVSLSRPFPDGRPHRPVAPAGNSRP